MIINLNREMAFVSPKKGKEDGLTIKNLFEEIITKVVLGIDYQLTQQSHYWAYTLRKP